MITTNCPIPFSDSDCVLLAHGSGGRMTHQLISSIFYPAFRNSLLEQDHDGCVFQVETGRIACSTDSFVVDPVFFPGGDIGDLAVNGTVNDLACCGARPLYLTAGFILEEGLPLVDLRRIVLSMKAAAERAGVQIVAGDTKVVERGKCDKLFINTSGIGVVPKGVHIAPDKAQPGDMVICSGPIGVHGITILSARESLGFETDLKSDTTSLNNMIGGLLKEIDEALLPIPDAVRSASEILGLDPLYIANEGLVLVILPEEKVEQALAIMRNYPEGKNAAVIGCIQERDHTLVKMKTLYGNYRIVDMLSGEQLPRIC